MTKFGLNEWQSGWRVMGDMTITQLLQLINNLIRLVHMTPDGPPTVDSYPKGGKGGIGVQIYQPLFESWLIISTWPVHNFIRVNLSSCKSFKPQEVTKFLEGHIGVVLESWSSCL